MLYSVSSRMLYSTSLQLTHYISAMCVIVYTGVTCQLGWSVPIELLIGSPVSISYQTDKSSSVCPCVSYNQSCSIA